MGRVIVIISAVSIMMLGVIEATESKQAKVLLSSLALGGIMIALEIFFPIAAINAVIAGLTLTILGLVGIVAISS